MANGLFATKPVEALLKEAGETDVLLRSAACCEKETLPNDFYFSNPPLPSFLRQLTAA